MKIAYFGDPNSHTYAAAAALFGEKEEFVGFATVREVVSALFGGADTAVVPMENSVEGYVNETLDCLLRESVYIEREIVMPIHQSLVVSGGADKEDIKTIYSHPQALSQCRNYLAENFPHAEVCAAKSTSDGLTKITDKSIAAIARSAGGENLKILSENIEDYDSNTTRFIVLVKNPTFKGNNCSIIFETQNTPGALVNVLNTIAREGLNMTKIQSRPAKTKLGRYVFFADFTFGGDKAELTDFLSKLQAETGMLKFSGKYESVSF